uniref:Protein kinase domain-containing protein n=1 Tax=Picea sitchensis TaxID=3332 RepID=A9NWR4_PICSI|nr:unknown [Picea sitchensis]
MLTAAMSFCCLDSFWKRKTSKDQAPHNEIGDVISSIPDVKVYPYAELKIATNIFHLDNKIGSGGFGSVYKGTLKDGTVVAVKQLSAQSKQGVKEFLTEIATISDVQHENLVKLHGCCAEEEHRILVYEYLEKNSIAQALLDNTRMDMDWTMRAKICMGTARGLSYLHEELVPHIVHRDIKASNVLLDRDLNPKIADFGLAKLFPDNVTHISTRVAGTIGYLAPEYAMRGQLTKKADIYSFGVLVLEIISGRSNTKSTFPLEEQFLLEWTWQLREESRLLDIVDPRLEEYPKEEVLRFIKVALLCTQAASNFRPSMSQVVAMLSKEININENLLSRPGFISDFKNLKVSAGTSRPPARTNLNAFHNAQVTAMHRGVSSSSTTTGNSTSVVSSSPATITQLEPR